MSLIPKMILTTTLCISNHGFVVILKLCNVSNFAKYRIIGPIFTIITIVIPSCVLLYLCGAIWKRILVRVSDRNMKNLAIYFLRIISSFVVTFIPGGILLMIAYVPSNIYTVKVNSAWLKQF